MVITCKNTVLENYRKSLILQQCKRSEQRLNLGKNFINMSKVVNFRQTVLPDRSTILGQKLVENAKIQKSKLDILAWFSNIVLMVVKWLDWDFLHWIIQKFFLGPESICIILEVKEKSVVHKALKLEGSTGVHHINHCLVISAQNILFLSSHHAPLLHTCPNGHRQCTSSDWTLLKCKI